MLKCKNLRQLRLAFVSIELTYGNMRDKSIDRLRDEYRLDSMLPLFQHGELRKVILDGPDAGWYGYTALCEIATWLKNEYFIHANANTEGAGKSNEKRAKELEVVLI